VDYFEIVLILAKLGFGYILGKFFTVTLASPWHPGTQASGRPEHSMSSMRSMDSRKKREGTNAANPTAMEMTCWGRFDETVSVEIYGHNLVKFKFVIMTLCRVKIP
jgi:hypothetical protein